jgi:hypothetical protein
MRSGVSMPFSILGVLMAALCSDPARADVSVQGAAQHLTLQATDATIADVLAALREHFGLNYRGPALDRHITATYQGALRQVVAHVLDGYDFVIKANGADIDVIVFDNGSQSDANPAPIVAQHHVD